MTTNHLTLQFSLMTLADLAEVDAIEQVSFSAPWSINTFRYEIESNPRSFYWVGRVADQSNNETSQPILVYGGYWLLGDEAHIVILATHPAWRRKGLAEALLRHIVAQIREIDVTQVTLEVRAGNIAAQQLYKKLGFEEVGRRKRYYRDNGEDALLLTLFNLQDPEQWAKIGQ